MGKYTITHTCGHNAQHQLFGKEEARERTLAWRAKGICPICYAAEQSANVDAASADLPELTGSEKQVAWARKIRVKVLKQVDDFAAQHKVKADKWAAARNALASKTSGSWWIDRQAAGVPDVMTEIAKEMAA